jgi:hypothetical protein
MTTRNIILGVLVVLILVSLISLLVYTSIDGGMAVTT